MRADSEILEASLAAAYVGGGYYNPVDEFQDQARPLTSERLSEITRCPPHLSTEVGTEPTFHVARLHQELLSLAAPDDTVFGMYDTGSYTFAVLITTETRLIEFELQVASGALERCGFFALHRHQASQGLARDFVPPSDQKT